MSTNKDAAQKGVTDNRDSRVRLTLDLSNRLNAEVEKIALEDGTTKAEVLRLAIELLAVAKKAKNAGLQVGAWTDDDQGKRVEREFIGV